MPNTFIMLSKWQNFIKSGHTEFACSIKIAPHIRYRRNDFNEYFYNSSSSVRMFVIWFCVLVICDGKVATILNSQL